MTQISNAFAPDAVNHHGVPTFARSTRQQARNFLRCGTLSGTFYVSQKDMANQQLLTLRRLADEDPAALAEEAVSAREDGFMRTMPCLALAVLSGVTGKQAFHGAAPRVIRIPTDATQFAELCLSGAVPGPTLTAPPQPADVYEVVSVKPSGPSAGPRPCGPASASP